MTEDKMRRMVTGIVVGATALIVVLLAVLIWQIVTMSVQKNRMDALAAEEARLEQQIEKGADKVETYKSKEGMTILAWQNGFVSSNGK